MKKEIGWLVILFMVVSFILNLFFYRQVSHFKKIEGKYKVYKVLDGDSFVISLDQTIRLANLDAPAVNLCQHT